MRESVLQTATWGPQFTGIGTITVTAGSGIITGVGTSFTSIPLGSIVQYKDDTGVLRSVVVSVIDSDTQFKTSITLLPLNTATAKSYTYIRIESVRSPYFCANNQYNKSYIFENKNPLFPNRFETRIFAPPDPFTFRPFFSANEGVLIKSLYCRLPYQYTMDDSPIGLKLFYVRGDYTKIANISTIGEGDSSLYITNENTEIPINAYVPPPPSEPGVKWGIAYDLSGFVEPTGVFAAEYPIRNNVLSSISQIDAPDQLNDNVIPITFGIRVQHANEPMMG